MTHSSPVASHEADVHEEDIWTALVDQELSLETISTQFQIVESLLVGNHSSFTASHEANMHEEDI